MAAAARAPCLWGGLLRLQRWDCGGAAMSCPLQSPPRAADARSGVVRARRLGKELFRGQKSLLSPDPGHSPVRGCVSEPGQSQQLVVFLAASSHRSSPGLPLLWWVPGTLSPGTWPPAACLHPMASLRARGAAGRRDGCWSAVPAARSG